MKLNKFYGRGKREAVKIMDDYLYFTLQCIVIILSGLIFAWMVRLRYKKRSISFPVFKWVMMVIIAINALMIGHEFSCWTPYIFCLLFIYPHFYQLEVSKEIDRQKKMNTPQEEIDEIEKTIYKGLRPWVKIVGVFFMVVIVLAFKGIFL